MNKDDFTDVAGFIMQRIGDSRDPTDRIAVAGAVGKRLVGIVLNSRDLDGLAGERFSNIRRDAPSLELGIVKNVVVGKIGEGDAPQDLPRAIDADRAAIRGEDLHAERGLLHDGAEAGLAFGEGLLGVLALGDILDNRNEAHHAAIRRFFGDVHAVHPAAANFFVRDQFFEFDAFSREGRFDVFPNHFVSGGANHIDDRAASDVLRIDAKSFGIGAVDEFETGFGVAVHNKNGQVVGDEAKLLFAIAKNFLGALSGGDIGEKNADGTIRGRADGKGVSIIPPVQGHGAILETNGLTAGGDAAIDVEPMLLVARRKRAHAFANGILEAGLRFKGGIHLHEAIVGDGAGLIDKHLDDAETGIDGIEERTIAAFGGFERFVFMHELVVGLAHRMCVRVRPKANHLDVRGGSRQSEARFRHGLPT